MSGVNHSSHTLQRIQPQSFFPTKRVIFSFAAGILASAGMLAAAYFGQHASLTPPLCITAGVTGVVTAAVTGAVLTAITQKATPQKTIEKKLESTKQLYSALQEYRIVSDDHHDGTKVGREYTTYTYEKDRQRYIFHVKNPS